MHMMRFTRDMRPLSSRTQALVMMLIMVLMPMIPFVEQNFKSGDYSEEVGEDLGEQIIMSSSDTGNANLLDLGGAHACAVGVSGNMKCWGNGSSGQLGLGNTQNVDND